MPLDISRIKALCFDVDGTLSDTDNLWVSRIERTLSALKFIFKENSARIFARWLIMATESPMNSIYHLMDYLSLDDNIARLYERTIQKRKNKTSNFWLMDGAKELLADLNFHYPLSIVSARDELSTLQFVEHFGLRDLFHSIATSQTCEHTKPYPHPVLWAARQMEVAPENCVMIGDTTVDILAGRAAGAQTVGVLCGFGTERELKRAGADLIIKELRDLIQYIH